MKTETYIDRIERRAYIQIVLLLLFYTDTESSAPRGLTMNEDHIVDEEIKVDICRTMATLYRRGLISATGGNVSARILGTNDFWITPHAIFKGELSASDLVKIGLGGNVVEGSKKPSIEVPMHRAIYGKRPDVNAIVHAHNPVTLGLALAGIEIQPVTVEAAFALGNVPVAPFALPGTEELAKAAVRHIVGVKAVVLQNHGVVGVGSDLMTAEATVEKLEEVSIAQWVACGLGKPLPIPRKYIETGKRLYEVS